MSMHPDIAAVLAGERRWCVVHGEALGVLATLPDASVDAVICDPPYSSGGMFRGDRADSTTNKYVQNGTHDTRAMFSGDNRDQRSWMLWCALWLEGALRVARPGAPIVSFIDWRQLPALTDAMQVSGWVWRGIVPWDKGEGVRPVIGRFRAQAEFAVWGSNGQLPLRDDVGVLPGAIKCAIPMAERFHQTTKPVDVMRFVSRICPPGGVVLDPFAGSGSTGLGATLEGRRFIGVELSEHYAKVARERLQAEERGSTLHAQRAGQVPLFAPKVSP